MTQNTRVETTEEPSCFYCGRTATDLYGAEASELLEDGYASPADYARDDGTYNSETNHFCCDSCYIRIGMPSGEQGWKAP